MLVKESLDIVKSTRYLLHVSSSKYRDSIYRNGLIPKDPKKSFYYSKEQVDNFVYEKPAIFATIFKDEIDIYDLINIKDKIYLVPNATLDDYEYDNYLEQAKINTEFKDCLKKANTIKDNLRGLYAQDCAEEVQKEIGNLMKKNGKFDIWLIDNNIAKAIWYEDKHGAVGNWLEGFNDAGSVMTYKSIYPNALNLIVASGKQIIVKRR
jgi:hypothetical protein